MSATITVKELEEQIQSIRKTAKYLRDTTKEKDDPETQLFMKGSAKGMENAAKIIEDYINTKEQK